MPTLTLKNLPADVHRRLKARASRHGRSLNGEAIACLRAAVLIEAVDTEAIIARARAHRAAIGERLSEAEVRKAKHAGRA